VIFKIIRRVRVFITSEMKKFKFNTRWGNSSDAALISSCIQDAKLSLNRGNSLVVTDEIETNSNSVLGCIKLVCKAEHPIEDGTIPWPMCTHVLVLYVDTPQNESKIPEGHNTVGLCAFRLEPLENQGTTTNTKQSSVFLEMHICHFFIDKKRNKA
jgi:hypothetical protein